MISPAILGTMPSIYGLMPRSRHRTVIDAKTGELLGAHMIGAEVTEMIQGYVVGKTLETTEAELMNTVFPHPTISVSCSPRSSRPSRENSRFASVRTTCVNRFSN